MNHKILVLLAFIERPLVSLKVRNVILEVLRELNLDNNFIKLSINKSNMARCVSKSHPHIQLSSTIYLSDELFYFSDGECERG